MCVYSTYIYIIYIYIYIIYIYMYIYVYIAGFFSWQAGSTCHKSRDSPEADQNPDMNGSKHVYERLQPWWAVVLANSSQLGATYDGKPRQWLVRVIFYDRTSTLQPANGEKTGSLRLLWLSEHCLWMCLQPHSAWPSIVLSVNRVSTFTVWMQRNIWQQQQFLENTR